MDYPQLNLIFGLGLILTLVVNISLRVLLSKLSLPVWLSQVSWMALSISILSALYIEYLFLRFMTPAFNWQILLGLLVIGGIGAFITMSLSRRETSPHRAGVLIGAQILVSLISVVLAFGLYRSLVAISAG